MSSPRRLVSLRSFFRRGLPWAWGAGLIWGALSLTVTGCQRQGEGERCSLLNGSADCQGEELQCTPASNLRLGRDGVDRCCPLSGVEQTDERCDPRTGRGTGGGDNQGSGGTTPGGAPNEGPDESDLGEVGDACQYSSDCVLPLICGPQGTCQAECREDRDCPGESVCSSEQTCVSPS